MSANIHAEVVVYEIDPANGTWVYKDDERVVTDRLCRACSEEDVIRDLEDGEWTPDVGGAVAWPCTIVRALQGVDQ